MQTNPIVVEVVKQPPATRDISVDVVIGMFAMAGLILAAAAVGAALTGGSMVLYRRWKDKNAPPAEPSHTRLGI